MIKKLAVLMTILVCMMTAVSAAELTAADLVFEKDKSGKYIYCNNHEFLRRKDLADTSNENARFIMNNDNLGPDKYALFVSHVNHTDIRNELGTVILEPGFDVEVDVLFRAKEDTKIAITAVGFEVPENKKYYFNGNAYTYEEEWGCFNAWATYLQTPICQIDSGKRYDPAPFTRKEVIIKAGEEMWLSRYIDNYREVPYYRPVNLLADFEILSGSADVNVAALKSTGTLKDRSRFVKTAQNGIYERDRQYKGIADSLNIVNTELNYTIDDTVWGSTLLPVKVYNHYVPEGNETTTWTTHINVRADEWSKKVSPQSDMLSFSYVDDSKKKYYGDNVPESARDNVWVFGTETSDTAEYPGRESGYFAEDYSPNYKLKPEEDETNACNLGNYGVSVNYKINITNDGDTKRYVNYNLSTISNNIVIVRDDEGNLMTPYALCKGAKKQREKDTMASIELPAHKTTSFTLTVILSTNYAGGMENSLEIDDIPSVVKVYEPSSQEVEKDYSYTGREFVKWDKGDLYKSYNRIDWVKAGMNDSTKQIFAGNWNEYQFIYTENGYMAKSTIYDGIPYYGVRDFYKELYFLDENFNYVSEYKFHAYPSAMSYANGVYYVNAGSPYYSKDGKEWNMADGEYSIPIYNYGVFSASMRRGAIYLSSDGVNFSKVDYQKYKPLYIDAVGDIYYYAYGSRLFVSDNGVYWTMLENGENIKSVRRLGNQIVVNNENEFELPEFGQSIVVRLKDEILGFETKPVIKDDYTLVPIRFIAEKTGAEVSWDEASRTVTIQKDETHIVLRIDDSNAEVNGEIKQTGTPPCIQDGYTMLPLRFVGESIGLDVQWDGENNIVEMK